MAAGRARREFAGAKMSSLLDKVRLDTRTRWNITNYLCQLSPPSEPGGSGEVE